MQLSQPAALSAVLRLQFTEFFSPPGGIFVRNSRSYISDISWGYQVWEDIVIKEDYADEREVPEKGEQDV